MTNKEYMKQAMRTKSTVNAPYNSNLLHAILGIADESGELVKIIKDKIFYSRVIDVTDIKEELGDIQWFVALALDTIGSSFDEVMEMNIAKLRKRYPGVFIEEDANVRDLEAERKALEQQNGAN